MKVNFVVVGAAGQILAAGVCDEGVVALQASAYPGCTIRVTTIQVSPSAVTHIDQIDEHFAPPE